jgi:hypothetical protein
MNNNPFSWHETYTSSERKQMIEEEINHLRMIKEAGISKESWLTGIIKAWSNLLAARHKSKSTTVSNTRGE